MSAEVTGTADATVVCHLHFLTEENAALLVEVSESKDFFPPAKLTDPMNSTYAPARGLRTPGRGPLLTKGHFPQCVHKHPGLLTASVTQWEGRPPGHCPLLLCH